MLLFLSTRTTIFDMFHMNLLTAGRKKCVVIALKERKFVNRVEEQSSRSALKTTITETFFSEVVDTKAETFVKQDSATVVNL